MERLRSAFMALVLVLGLVGMSNAQGLGPPQVLEGDGHDGLAIDLATPGSEAAPARRLSVPPLERLVGAVFQPNVAVASSLNPAAAFAWRPAGPTEAGTAEAQAAAFVSHFGLAAASFAAARNPTQLRVMRKIPRTFVPIPMLAWKRSLPLGRSAQVALNPSIVFGRRLTIAPELSRGGRTIGVAFEMKVRFDAPVGAQGHRRSTSALFSQLLATFQK